MREIGFRFHLNRFPNPILLPRTDSTNERLAFHKATPKGANVVTVTGAY